MQRPRLVVVISVDQLARWVLDDVYPHLPDGGIRRLVASGTDFVNCAYQHACTETGPGHATIGTGATAAVHGIIGNEWWDRGSRRDVYCVADSETSPVGYEYPVSMGPGRLLVATLGETMKAQLGQACKVISLSWKDRSAILMAGHGADLAAWMNFANGDFVSSTGYVQALPAWLVKFNRNRHVDLHFGRVWRREDNTAAFAGLIDDRPAEGLDYNHRRRLPQRIDGGLNKPGPRYYDHLYRSPYANQVLLALARVAIVAEQLGQDENPDLLYLGFSANDVVGHRFGPRSHEARDTSLKLDRQLAELFSFLDEKVGVEHYAVLLTADHGVGPIPETLKAAGKNAGREPLLYRKILSVADSGLREKYGSPPRGTPRWVQGVNGRELHLDRSALAVSKVPLAEAVACVVDVLTDLRELTQVAAAIDLVAAASDPVLRALFHGRSPSRSGDVFYARRANWLATTTRASHGSPYLYDRSVPLLAMGQGIHSGLRDESTVSPGLIAVLAASLLGIEPPLAARETIPEGVLSH